MLGAVDEPRRLRVCVAAMAFASVAPVAYLVQRLLDRARGVAFDPTSVVSEPHVAFYWRCAIAAWWGGLAALTAHAIAGRGGSPDRWAWWLALAAAPVGVVHAALSWLFP